MNGSSPDSEKPKSKRRWMQFSLSTLFVLTLGIAGFLSGYKVGEKRGYQSGLNKRLSEECVARVYDVSDIVLAIDLNDLTPPRSSLPPAAPKENPSMGFGDFSSSPAAGRHPGSSVDFGSLIELITTTIKAGTWTDVGGAGNNFATPFQESFSHKPDSYCTRGNRRPSTEAT